MQIANIHLTKERRKIMEKKELNKSPFETIKSEKIKLGRFNVVQDEVRVNGNIRPYDYLEMMEGVSILPFHGENIITLREYRYPIRSWQTELPGGLIDPGETPEQAAVRELKEETGYEAEEVISLGYFYPSFGSTDEKIYLFAIQCGKLGEESLDPAEVLKLLLGEGEALIGKMLFIDAKTWSTDLIEVPVHPQCSCHAHTKVHRT